MNRFFLNLSDSSGQTESQRQTYTPASPFIDSADGTGSKARYQASSIRMLKPGAHKERQQPLRRQH
jgi:hypothetical protein